MPYRSGPSAVTIGGLPLPGLLCSTEKGVQGGHAKAASNLPAATLRSSSSNMCVSTRSPPAPLAMSKLTGSTPASLNSEVSPSGLASGPPQRISTLWRRPS